MAAVPTVRDTVLEKRGPMVMRRALSILALLAIPALTACASDVAAEPPPPPPCDQLCKDGIALRGMREIMKLVFNLTLQGKPVGAHDYTVPCPLGGAARVFGTATSNAVQGSTEVDLTYVIDGCTLLERDDDVKENYRLTVTGTLVQKGTLAVQPTSTTALGIKSDSVTVAGTIYDPPEPYEATACKAQLAQIGSKLTGLWCGRETTVDL